jgi:curved DNA-binding protein CbpA
MTSQNNLEIKGNLQDHPLAELLIEIFQVRLNGSLRLNNESQKSVIYFDAGEVVFAVSNKREFRLFEMLLRANKITKEQLLKFSDFTNDFLLGQNLIKENLFSKLEIDALFTRQIEDILKNGFDWLGGDWNFSPLVRAKGAIRFRVGSNRILMEYARNLPDKTVVSRFMHLQEVFGTKSAPPAYIDLSPQESFVFSRFENSSLSVVDVKNLSGLSDSETLKILYTLWLGGFLNRQKWNTAFSDRKTSKILSASISLIKGQEAYVSNESQPSGYKMPEMTKPETPIEETKQVIENISLAGYLAQVENAANFYEILDVEPKAIQTDIKQAYFSLAKRFHPDLFHKEVDADLQQRVQHAFGKLAQAYDTLRHEKSREVYNYKIRKDLETKEKRQKTNFGSENAGNQKQFEQALDEFEQGLSLLMDEEFETAIPFLARAVHLANNNARFHAYYGKALASDKNQRHKAEAELQAAVKLDENNANYRLMLAEFFIEVGLAKRAEGELNRLLAIFPDNKEATILLDTLRTK